MRVKYLSLHLILSLISGYTTSIAQDSIPVWKIHYEYLRWPTDSWTVPDAQFPQLAPGSGITLYYTASSYRLQYTDDYWEIGDFHAAHRYTIRGGVATEGLSAAQQMPELYDLDNLASPIILWSQDYDMRNEGLRVTIRSIPCAIVVFYPQNKAIDVVYEVYVSDSLPKIPWYPYTFLSRLPAGFLGLYKTNATRDQVEGFEAQYMTQTKVPANFLRIPEEMKIEHMPVPPMLNE